MRISANELDARVRAIDPMADVMVTTPLVGEVVGTVDAGAPRVAAEAIALTPRPRPRRRRALAVVAAVAVAGTVAGLTVARWPSTGSGPQPTAATSSAADPGAVTAWAAFPVDQDPRPVVVTYSDVVDPASGFPPDDSKVAYLDKQVELGTTALPTAPAQADGYALRPAADAIAEISGGHGTNTSFTLTITSVSLATHAFATDRGDQTLPAWAIRFAGVTDPAYVLAVADRDRFAGPTPGQPGGAGEAAVRGRQLTFAFTPEHTSTGPCDPGYTQSVDVHEYAAVVELSITTITEPPSGDGSTACALTGTVSPSPVSGTPGTRTVTLAGDLGNKPVVDANGVPWIVTTGP